MPCRSLEGLGCAVGGVARAAEEDWEGSPDEEGQDQAPECWMGWG